MHTQQIAFSCSYCLKLFSGAPSLKAHLHLHTGKKSYSCTHCSKSFVQARDLRDQMRDYTGQKPYCVLCFRTFNRPCTLRIHMRMHTGKKPCGFSHCRTTFITSTSLQSEKVVSWNVVWRKVFILFYNIKKISALSTVLHKLNYSSYLFFHL